MADGNHDPHPVNILAISDVQVAFIYSPTVAERFKTADLVVSCGDLPYYYLEYVISMLDKPLYYVNGNHQNQAEYSESSVRYSPWGAIPLHRRHLRWENKLLLTGIDGSLQYNYGPYQYTQGEMWAMTLLLVPGLLINKLRFGRYLDVFVTHAPPWKIHDKDDRPHRGIKAFRWFDSVFRPTYHLHGHIHVYRGDTITETLFGQTRVVNAYGYKELAFERPGEVAAPGRAPRAAAKE